MSHHLSLCALSVHSRHGCHSIDPVTPEDSVSELSTSGELPPKGIHGEGEKRTLLKPESFSMRGVGGT